MKIDLDQPSYTMRQASEWTGADMKTIDNYILHKHVTPDKASGGRLFSARQLIEIDLMARLGKSFRIPPSVSKVLAHDFARRDIVDQDAQNVEDASWVKKSYVRAQQSLEAGVRASDETGEDMDPVEIVVPIQLFVRSVLFHIKKAANA